MKLSDLRPCAACGCKQTYRRSAEQKIWFQCANCCMAGDAADTLAKAYENWQEFNTTSITTLQAYSDAAVRTKIYPDNAAIFYPALKLAGEAGEVAEKVGKAIRDANWKIQEGRRQALKMELGDVLWYVNALAIDLGFTLEEVANANIEKLSDRQIRGVLGGEGDER